MGPYNTTSQGNAYTLTAICNLTGYLMTTPLPDKNTLTVVIRLFQKYYLNLVSPRIFHSEQ